MRENTGVARLERWAGKGRLLVVDDDSGVVDYLVEMLVEDGYAATGVTSAQAVLDRLAMGEQFDLIVSDIEMPQMRGLTLLEQVLAARPGQLMLMITAFGSIDMAVQAVRAGACDFLPKPFQIEQLLIAVERALRERAMRREIVRLRSTVAESLPGMLVTRSVAMQRVLDLARRAARSDATVLITGESGVGKAQLARFIHDSGARAHKRFLQVNCASLPIAVADAELFGVARTTSGELRDDRPGLFAQAQHGTMLLDEIGELPIESQPRLLQTLETGRVRPVGGDGEVEVDVRLIAAATRPLEDLLKDRRFRADLYYRLNVIRIEIPPLRDRAEDLQGLVDVCLQQASHKLQRSIIGISDDAMRWMLRYAWPGNVRELANLIERAVAMSDHDTIVLEDLAQVSQAGDDSQLLNRAAAIGMTLEEVERAYIRKVLELAMGNKSVAARVLGIDRRTLYRKIDEADQGLDDGP